MHDHVYKADAEKFNEWKETKHHLILTLMFSHYTATHVCR